jgi:hypothetical protein
MWPYFREIVTCDTEYEIGTGERPVPVCVVAKELISGRGFEFPGSIWADVAICVRPRRFVYRLLRLRRTRYLSCVELADARAHPRSFLRISRSHQRTADVRGRRFVGRADLFGLDGMAAAEKRELQEALGAGTWPGRFMPKEILDYCQFDSDALERLLAAVWSEIDLLRGRFPPRWNGMACRLMPRRWRACARAGHQRLKVATLDDNLGPHRSIALCMPH